MFYMLIVAMLMMFSGGWIFCYKYEHLLTVLLSLEYISLSLFFLIFLSLHSWEMFFSLIFITFTACEGALGLSVLVMMSRTHGGDYFKTLNLFM